MKYRAIKFNWCSIHLHVSALDLNIHVRKLIKTCYLTISPALSDYIYSLRESTQFSIFPDIFPVVILYSVTLLRYCGALGAIRYGECRFHYCISHSVVILKQLSLPDATEMMTIFVPWRVVRQPRLGNKFYRARISLFRKFLFEIFNC